MKKITLEDAIAAYDGYDIESALNIYTILLRKDPRDIDLLSRRAAVHAKLKYVDDSHADVAKILDNDPNWPKNGAIVHGYLTKDPNKVGASKRRYFYLKKKFLFYYDVPTSAIPIGWICLEDCEIELVLNKFQIVTPERTYSVAADTDEERDLWIDTLTYLLSEKYSIHDINQNSQVYLPFSGSLGKRGEHNISWKDRWFVVRGSLLFYYQDENSTDPQGYIDLRKAEIKPISFKANGKSQKYKFVIETPTRTYYLYSKTETDRAKWIIKLREAREKEIQYREAFMSIERVISMPIEKPQRPTSVPPELNFLPRSVSLELSEDASSLDTDDMENNKISTKFVRPNSVQEQPISTLRISDYSSNTSINQKTEEERNKEAILKRHINKSQNLNQNPLQEPLIEEESSSWWEYSADKKNQTCQCTIL